MYLVAVMSCISDQALARGKCPLAGARDHGAETCGSSRQLLQLNDQLELLPPPDADRLNVLDVRLAHVEEQFVAYGVVGKRVWVCVFTVRDEVYRIISVRKANGRETKRYKETPR